MHLRSIVSEGNKQEIGKAQIPDVVKFLLHQTKSDGKAEKPVSHFEVKTSQVAEIRFVQPV